MTGWIMIEHASTNEERAGVAILLPKYIPEQVMLPGIMKVTS